MNIVAINLIGILVIGIIIGWFWFGKPRAVHSKNLVEITMKDGVYHPALIEARINEPITLRFIREDTSPCAERVNFPTLNISKILSLQAPTDIPLLIQQPGEYEFSCQMNMYRGKLMIIA